MSSVRLKIPKDLIPLEARNHTLKKVSEVLSRYAKEGGMPLLHPEDDMKVCSLILCFSGCKTFCWVFIQLTHVLQVKNNSSYRKAARRIEALESQFEKHDIAKSPIIEEKLKVLHKKKELIARIKSIKKAMRSSSVLAFKDELKARKRVLRRLG